MLKLIQAVDQGIIDYFEIQTESHIQSIKIYANKDNNHKHLIILREELISCRTEQMAIDFIEEKIDEFLEQFRQLKKEQQDAIQSASNSESHSG